MTRLHRLGVSLAVVAVAGCEPEPEEESARAAATEMPCDRACLIELARGVATGARALDPEARLTENGAEIEHAESWLARASEVNIHGDYADATKHNGIAIGTGIDRDGRPTIFGLRLRHRDERTTEAELIVAHEGEASLFPPQIPVQRNPVMAETVPDDARTSPERMIEIANAYFDGIEVDSGANVPVTGDCNRIENGVQITNSARAPDLKCNSLEGFDYITEVRERRFPVVDVERGVVVAHVAFYIPGGDYERVVNGMATTRHYDPRALFLIEAFKIEAGEARLIEATMRNMPLGATMGWP